MAELCFRLQAVDQVDDIEVARLLAEPDTTTGNAGRQVGLARASTADQNDVALMIEGCTHQLGVNRRPLEGELLNLLGYSKGSLAMRIW